MSKSEFSFSAEVSRISDHQQDFKSQKIKGKLADRYQKIVVQLC